MTLREAPSSGNVDQGPFSPAQADEDVQSGKQDLIPSSNEADVAYASLSPLERLPTEILPAIISYDHLTWHDLDRCSRVSRRLREVALPERGIVPALPIKLIRGAYHDKSIVELPPSKRLYKRTRRNSLLCAEIRRVEICETEAPYDSEEVVEEWAQRF